MIIQISALIVISLKIVVHTSEFIFRFTYAHPILNYFILDN